MVTFVVLSLILDAVVMVQNNGEALLEMSTQRKETIGMSPGCGK
jgi:hypothetical protein